MKKVLLTAAALVMISTSAYAVIKGSAHDFSTGGMSASYGNTSTAGEQICVYCHTPHNAKTSALLWNRNNGTDPVVMYDKSVSGTLNLTMGASIGTTSTLCLSCHDGSVAVDSFASNAGTKNITTSANLSGTLTNDHPIGFSYAPVVAADTDVVANGGTVNLPLFVNGALTDSMECATCHDVHAKTTSGGTQANFLRINNAGSNLCLNCHTK